MAIDPGTALAIVSLGITVCDGIITYCSAFKHRKEDVQSLTAISTELQNILQDVQTWLHRCPLLSVSLANKVDSCVKACLGHIGKVLSMCGYHSPPTTNDIKSRILNLKRGIQFPLKKDTIQNLKDQMESLRANVKLAIILLSSDFTFEGLEALKKMIQQSEQTTTQSIKAYIDQAEQNISGHIGTSEEVIQSNVQRLGHSVSTQVQEHTQTLADSFAANMEQNRTYLAQSASSSMQQIELTVTRAQDSLSQELNANQQSLVDEIREIKQLIRLQRNSPLSQNSANVSSGPQLPLSKRRRQRRPPAVISEISELCICNAKITTSVASSYSRKWFQKISDVCLIHDRDCPVWYTSQRKVTVGVNIQIFRFSISGSIDFSGGYYSWRNWSAAPSPNLRCRTTVTSNSGAFAILTKLNKSLYRQYRKKDRIYHPERALTKCLVSLHEAFSVGKASPHDIDEYGNNILHIITQDTIYLVGVFETVRFIQKIQSLWSVDLYGVSDGMLDYARTPIASLLRNAGWLKWRGGDVVSKARDFHFALDWLMDSDFDVGQSFDLGEVHIRYPWSDLTQTYLFQHPSILFSLNRPEFIEAAQCNLLAIAILKREERSLYEEIAKHPDSLGKVNRFGQNAIHFATEWTEGLSVLLKSGCITHDILNQPDYANYSPLNYAALQWNIESVEMLIEAGACFSLSTLKDTSPNCRTLLISTLYERRRQLRDLAMEQKDSKGKTYGECFGAFFSDSASRLYLHLAEESKIAVPEALRSSVLPEDTLYHQVYPSHFGSERFRYLGKELVQDLLAAGFLNVDEVWNGVTPLMSLHFGDIIEVAEMFLEHGADPNKELPLDHQNLQDNDDERRHRAIHKLAYEIGTFSRSGTIQKLIAAHFLQSEIFQSSLKDPCSCYCSIGGCTPFTFFLKGITDRFHKGDTETCRSLRSLAGKLHEFDLSRQNDSIIEMEFVRMMTFESLQLTHTCCKFSVLEQNDSRICVPNRRVKEKVEIDRIHEEESLGLQLLEILMEDFTTKFTNLGISLQEFFTGYWRERMEEELYRNDPTPMDELNGQKELGVWLKEQWDIKQDFFAQLWVDEVLKSTSSESSSDESEYYSSEEDEEDFRV